MLRAGALVVLPLAAVIAVGAVRAMTFVAPSTHPLRQLVPAFGSHPDALVDRAMAEIGGAAARGGTVPPSARQAMLKVAGKAPLAPDPYLVEGTIAGMNGDPLRAERLFLAARARDPRSPGARYFLADRYLKTNRILPGLVEMGALARLSERAAQPLIPALAAYAKTPGAIDELRRFFKLSPATRDRTLALLAEDARNAPLVLALAPEPRPGAAKADWHGRMVQSLVTAGDYAGAEALWRKISGVGSRALLYNPDFRQSSAPPPFNWQFSSGASGVAEPSGSGGLNVIYYGRDDVALASQLLRLSPGRYRLAMRVEGSSPAGALSWGLRCVPDNKVLLGLPVETAGKEPGAGLFAVPAGGCPAQALELRGRSGETAATTQLAISGLKLERLAAAP